MSLPQNRDIGGNETRGCEDLFQCWTHKYLVSSSSGLELAQPISVGVERPVPLRPASAIATPASFALDGQVSPSHVTTPWIRLWEDKVYKARE